MKLSKADKDMFRVLSQGDLGRNFCSYLDRIIQEICDSRNWKETDTRESTTKAAEYIQRELRDKVALKSKVLHTQSIQYE